MNFIQKIKDDRTNLLKGMGVPEKMEFKPDPFQIEAITSASGGIDTLVIAPTGSGKTYIAIQAIVSAVAQGARAIYTTPLKALSNSKYAELKEMFEPEYSVGILTGDRKIDTSADIVVATTEIYRNELYNARSNYSVVILDEVHYIADAQRGPVWEEAIVLTPKDSTLLMLSASISNDEEISSWLEMIRGKEVNVVKAIERPVELRLGFLHPDFGVMPLRSKGGSVYKLVEDYYADSKLDNSGMRLKPNRSGSRKSRNAESRSNGKSRHKSKSGSKFKNKRRK